MSATDHTAASGLLVLSHEHVVEVNGQALDLTACEYEILMRLAEHPGWVLSAAQLASEGEEADRSAESVSVLISRLRRKLSQVGAADRVETVRGVGYRLRPSSDGDATAVSATFTVSLRDVFWQLQEAVFEVEHSGTAAQREVASEALEVARRRIYSTLAK